jgi:predicted RNA binding protein YcfA (HicA-like mRNA interferase family)
MGDLKELKRLAEAQGWRVEPTKGSHWKFIPPDKTKQMVVLPGSSCSRVGLRNALSALKRSGLQFEAA